MQADELPRPDGIRQWLAKARADRQLHGVLAVWAACCLATFLCIHKFGVSLPWADEWEMTPIACGQEPLSWHWLMTPSNEHRVPLTRLIMLGLGRLSHWNWQAAHYANLVSLGLGALALVLAARAIRGQSSLGDTFLSLVVLTPWSFETIWWYGYSYGVAAGITCVAIAMVAVRWPQRSYRHLASYVLMALAVTLAAGPPGNFLAVGLAGALLVGWRAEARRGWKVSAVAGAVLIVTVSGLLLATMPRIEGHAHLRSHSLAASVKAAAHAAVGWMGQPPLHHTWPWAFVVVLVPGLWLAGLIVRDLRLPANERQGLRAWADLGLVWLGSLLILGALGYGRGNSDVSCSRYVVLTMPFAILLYLLLVRLRAHPALPQGLALVMAICVGWCCPSVLGMQGERRHGAHELTRALSRGNMALTTVCKKYHQAVGFPYHPFLTNCMMLLQRHNQGVFWKINRDKRRAAVPALQTWKADAAERIEGCDVVPEGWSTQGRALRVRPGEQKGLVVYRVQIPVGGAYRVCCRLRGPKEGTFTVAVDGDPTCQQDFAASPDYLGVLSEPLELAAGEHTLALTLWPGPTDVDVVELVPAPPANAEEIVKP